MALTSILGGVAGLPSFVAFGDNFPGVSVLGNTINLNGLGNEAFVVPRNGTITAFSAYFSTTAALNLIGTTITVQAQIYQNTTLDNNFTAIPGTALSLSPTLNGLVSIGTVSDGLLSSLSIPVLAGTRLLLVYSITATGVSLINEVIGTGSAGLVIA